MMRNIFILTMTAILCIAVKASADTISQTANIDTLIFQDINSKLMESEQLRKKDSVLKAELERQLRSLKTSDNLQKEDLLNKLKAIELKEKERIATKKARIDSLRNKISGYPVLGPLDDTLFLIYSKLGESSPSERAKNATEKIKLLYKDDYLKLDSLIVVNSEFTHDILYKDIIVISISENDAMWYGEHTAELANSFQHTIKNSISQAIDENSLSKILIRIGLVFLVLCCVCFVLWLIKKGYNKLVGTINSNKKSWFKDLSYRDYTFLTAEQEIETVLFFTKLLKWIIYAILLYITLPIIFSIFPFSRTWADKLFELIWSPFKSILISIWKYIPNVITILIIYFVMKYVIRFVKYIFKEIELEKLKISGFHADWAAPTFSIVKFLLYAFMIVLIFPQLPGSDSAIFKGVSVFLGVLFSLGSSTAIANMIAGLVITYMRPFKIGDRIRIGDVSGDIIEKTLLVTRVKTITNEVITIPNSAILNGNTINYSSDAENEGLILHTTVTIGYDAYWKDVHEALIEAAKRTDNIMKSPEPFVLQLSLDDFYISYQINAHTKEANKQGSIYSQLHQNIQDVFNERGIEIMSPHYRTERNGEHTTIPQRYSKKA